ncbi:MAG: 50S ribosomal protein L29 [Rhodothermales bacterium]|nr:50S ribosomal protein L29 [Rhodothermales bacterium]
MKAKEISELSLDEIAERVREETDQLRQLHFQHAIAELPNPMIIREKRRLIARLKTILKQKETATT